MMHKYDIEKDNLELKYDRDSNSYSLYYNNEKVPIRKLSKKSYYKLVEANLKLINKSLVNKIANNIENDTNYAKRIA